MKKLRTRESRSKFYPEFKFLFWWVSFIYHEIPLKYETLDQSEQFLKDYVDKQEVRRKKAEKIHKFNNS